MTKQKTENKKRRRSKAEKQNGAHFGPAQAGWKWTPLSCEAMAGFEADRRWPIHAVEEAETVPDDSGVGGWLLLASEKRLVAAAPGAQNPLRRDAPSWCGCPQAGTGLVPVQGVPVAR
ncbi:hypothetical protein [Polaromonas sp.]|uniref:hypothetical protein n=1 Tax=Polaromonas sp. TaxID=1869339 RepID=UPI0037C92B83